MTEFLKSRREFLRWTAFSAAGLALTGCDIFRRDFTIETRGPDVRLVLYLPEGENHPETGSYTTFLSEMALIKIPIKQTSLFKEKILRVDADFTTKGKPAGFVGIIARVGKLEELYPRDKLEIAVNMGDLTKAHNLNFSWKDWFFREVKLDGNVVWKPKTD